MSFSSLKIVILKRQNVFCHELKLVLPKFYSFKKSECVSMKHTRFFVFLTILGFKMRLFYEIAQNLTLCFLKEK